MYYRIVILLCFTSLSVFSQTLTYKYVDSITYYQLINNQSDSLIKVADTAWKENIDFYYLRMRVGVVYYNNKNFEKALPHFIRANEMNPADTITQEYLYYSYIFSDRKNEADIFAEKLEPFMKNKFQYKKNKIEAISIAGGYAYTSNSEQGKTKPIISKYNIYGEALYQGNLIYSNALIEYKISNRTKMMCGMWYYYTSNVGVVNIPDRLKWKEFQDSHYQYNIGMSYYYKNGWNASVAGSYYIQNSSVYSAKFNESTNKYNFLEFNSQVNSYAIVLGIGKRIGKVHPVLNLATANFTNQQQLQAEGTLVFYPFGNTNVYSYSGLSYQNDNAENRFVFFQKVGIRLHKIIWAEGNFSYGNHFNYISKFASLTYNTVEPIQLISGFDLKLYLKRLELIIGYRFQQLQGKYIYYTAPVDFKTQKYYYTNHLISTTLKWNF